MSSAGTPKDKELEREEMKKAAEMADRILNKLIALNFDRDKAVGISASILQIFTLANTVNYKSIPDFLDTPLDNKAKLLVCNGIIII